MPASTQSMNSAGRVASDWRRLVNQQPKIADHIREYPHWMAGLSGDFRAIPVMPGHKAIRSMGAREAGRRISTVTLLLVLALGSTAALFAGLYHQADQLFRGMALQGTELQVLSIVALRQLYSTEVVERLRAYGIEATHDYHERQRAIPLPATLTMELGSKVTERREGAHLRLYSDYPFPWRKEGGPRDEFEREALRAIRAEPDQAFYRFEPYEGRYSLRYALADRMTQNCVDCHNRRPDSPKRDWKVGDVRGVVEFIRPLDRIGPIDVVTARSGLTAVLAGSAGTLGLCIVGLGITVRRLRQTSERVRHSESRLRAIVENAAPGIVIADADGAIQSFNAAAERMFGYEAREIIGQNIRLLMPQADRGRYEDYLRELSRTEARVGAVGQSRELVGLRKGGETFPLELRISEVRIGRQIIHTAHLTDITERRRSEEALADRARMAGLAGDVGLAVTHLDGLHEVLQRCAERIVERLDGAVGRIWTLHETEDMLELQANAGQSSSSNGDQTRIPIGRSEIGLIAKERTPYLSNQVIGDTRIEAQPWARREGLVAFAGYPLLVRGKLVGVLALFSRSTLPQETMNALAAVADTIALFVQRHRDKEAVRRYAADLEAANEELQNATDAAHAANRAKSEFLANMSHEIRTPMTAILGFSDVLAESIDSPTDTAQRFEAIDAIRRNGRHLLDLINDILDLSRIEAGRLEIESLPCRVPEILEDVASVLRVRALNKGLTLHIEYDGGIPEVIQTDPTRLRQVLINLIGNAIKFTEMGEVRVRIRFVSHDAPPSLCIDIVDTGIGMTPEQAEGVFRPFAQADASMARRFGGSGLGLTISRRLAKLLGGNVEIVATRPGSGTHIRATVATGSIAAEKLWRPEPSAPDARIADSEKPSAAPLHAARILLAEDGLDNQRLISHVLSRAGANVQIAENGKVAYEAALREWRAGAPFDCVLMDMQMPIMTGYEATHRLRDEGYTGAVIALTAHAMTGDREKCLAAGCDDYATKPIDRATLIDTIAQHTGRAATV